MNPREYHRYTISVIECGHAQDPKRPVKPWAHAQRTISVPDEATHYGIVCGAVSNHLECIDYDRKHDPSGDTYSQFRDTLKAFAKHAKYHHKWVDYQMRALPRGGAS